MRVVMPNLKVKIYVELSAGQVPNISIGGISTMLSSFFTSGNLFHHQAFHGGNRNFIVEFPPFPPLITCPEYCED